MIVLDETIQSHRIIRAINSWYPGQVISVMDLRPATLIKDDGIATLLNQVKQPTFVTINVDDFWLKLHANRRYCIVALPLTNAQAKQEASMWLRKLLQLPEFHTKSARMGQVIYARPSRIEYYGIDRQIHSLFWSM
ncbi:MAG: hypothetical protein ACOYNY_04565 [Caldilineaceae bacterium]